jgi:hypothetical protein
MRGFTVQTRQNIVAVIRTRRMRDKENVACTQNKTRAYFDWKTSKNEQLRRLWHRWRIILKQILEMRCDDAKWIGLVQDRNFIQQFQLYNRKFVDQLNKTACTVV